AQERGAIAGPQPDRQIDAEAADQRVEIIAPRDRDRDVADGVLEDQIPADDPRHQLAERRVRVRVRTAGLRDHRGEFRVTETGESARAAEKNEREYQRGAGADADHFAVGSDLSRGGRADGAEDAGADDRADR